MTPIGLQVTFVLHCCVPCSERIVRCVFCSERIVRCVFMSHLVLFCKSAASSLFIVCMCVLYIESYRIIPGFVV